MEPTEAIAIKTTVFEGPLELLIELVEKRKLLINDISLAEVTDEYMQRVSAMQELSLPNTAQFVALAATLLLIKSKSLLPVLELTTEEESAIDDLEERLQRFAVYREGAHVLSSRFGAQPLYTPEYTPPREPIFAPDPYCSRAELRAAMERVLAELPKQAEKPVAAVTPTISLEAMISRLQDRIERRLRTRFSELRATEPDRKNLVVGFLAILELCKQGGVLVRQEHRFADIEIEREHAGTPRYY
ncbi:MAG: segregation/condensation protein A [Spirochaetes bacterium]|jgi:segregation and condensation protein A|nr:segregation/condensation protein A [Spirochaetota bacterium]